MEDLLSKEHYCYKIHTLLMKSSAYTRPFYRHAPAISTNPPHFYKKTLILPSMIFQKSQPSINKGVHIMETMISVKEVT